MARNRHAMKGAWDSGQHEARRECASVLSFLAEDEADPIRKEAFKDAAMAVLALTVWPDEMGWPTLADRTC